MFKLISTGLGIGYLKGGGTVAAVACCLALYLARSGGITTQLWPTTLITGALLGIGTWAAHEMEAVWGKDSYRVVIDEVAGMWISMLFIPITGPRLLAGLVLFRIFDIAKPFYIRRMEKLPGGVGVMMDDVLAGIYSNILLQIGLKLDFF